MRGGWGKNVVNVAETGWLPIQWTSEWLLSRLISCFGYSTTILQLHGGRDSAVSVATGYGLDGPEIESKGGGGGGVGEIFCVFPDRPRDPYSLLFSQGTAAGAACSPPNPFCRRSCEWVGAIPLPPPLFLHWNVMGWIEPLPFNCVGYTVSNAVTLRVKEPVS